MSAVGDVAAGWTVGRALPGDHRLVERSADTVLSAVPVPLRVLDVCSGSGALLRELIIRVPYGQAFVGVDPSPEAVAFAGLNSDRRIAFLCADPAGLPFPDANFDLVVAGATGRTCFDVWPDQRAGLAELARVVAQTGTVVLIARSAAWMRTGERATRPGDVAGLLDDVGLRVVARETVGRRWRALPLVRAFIAFP